MSRLTTKQRNSRRRGKLATRIHHTGYLHFENLPVEREIASTNTWEPYTTGASVIERHAYVKGTNVLVSIFIENGQRNPVTLRAMPNSIAAELLINAGYVPTRP